MVQPPSDGYDLRIAVLACVKYKMWEDEQSQQQSASGMKAYSIDLRQKVIDAYNNQ
ncbi:hypothetical protein H6G97_44630, partial [Nostoc flagelliforme FACHB-838]|nr:hypothetical protein [Nostoc flagelliforme FACHB-838]